MYFIVSFRNPETNRVCEWIYQSYEKRRAKQVAEILANRWGIPVVMKEKVNFEQMALV